MDEQDVEASGWDAIDHALRQVYGDQEPAHWGTMLPWGLGGNEPLQGVSAYVHSGEGGHFHYVGYGLTELYEKESTDPEWSGMGFELTFRLACGAEKSPPLWPVSMMQNLARYVLQSGNVFEPFHHMDANGPIALESTTDLTAIVFVADPELPPIASPNGRVEFIQIVGVTGDELACVQSWNAASLLALLAGHSPLHVTALERKSILTNLEAKARIKAGQAKDGASTGTLFNPRFDFRVDEDGTPRISLGAKEAQLVGQLLEGRLQHGNTLVLTGRERMIVFEPSSTTAFAVDATTMTLRVTEEQVRELATRLEPLAGEYRIAGLVLSVERSEIRDAQGEVVRTIG